MQPGTITYHNPIDIIEGNWIPQDAIALDVFCDNGCAEFRCVCRKPSRSLWQCVFDQQEQKRQQWLINDIIASGVLVPGIAKRIADKNLLLDGHTRLFACVVLREPYPVYWIHPNESSYERIYSRETQVTVQLALQRELDNRLLHSELV